MNRRALTCLGVAAVCAGVLAFGGPRDELFSASMDGSVRAWNWQSGATVRGMFADTALIALSVAAQGHVAQAAPMRAA